MIKILDEHVVLTMDKNHPPIAKASSGDTIQFITKDCFSNTINDESQKLTSVPWDVINPATGPLYIEDACIGDVLKVEILDIILIGNSVVATGPDFGVFGKTLTTESTKILTHTNDVLYFNEHLTLPINPMIGVIGTAPAGAGIPTGSPGPHGGNMDCKRITKGTTLYLPVNVEGALLSMGDVHALMGDGEVCVCGAETPAKITVRVSVHKNCHLPTPFLLSPELAITIYSHESMHQAAEGATFNMHHFIMHALKMSYDEATMLLSLVGNLAVCQMVDPLITLRMEIPRDILQQYGYNFI